MNYKEAAQAYTKLFKQVKVRDSPMMYKVTDKPLHGVVSTLRRICG